MALVVGFDLDMTLVDSGPGIAATFAVRARNGRVVVVTAKYEPNAHRCLDYVGLRADAVHGWKHGAAKGAVLANEGAQIYVGDTLGDVEGARSAGATSVAIPSGPHRAEELRAAGAPVVLADLTEFPDWLGRYSL